MGRSSSDERDQTMDNDELVGLALRTRERAYAPYSNFKVGACLLAAKGRVFTGCNVENASYGLTVCAERVALWKATRSAQRSEEHTSELQSLAYLVCRLLLEKKKTNHATHNARP